MNIIKHIFRTMPDDSQRSSGQTDLTNSFQSVKPAQYRQVFRCRMRNRSNNSNTSPFLTMTQRQRLDHVREQIVGRNIFIEGPFGKKLKLYADYTASGQDVKFVADELTKITELYANTHTESSYTGAYMNHLLHQAEAMILKECNASHEEYFIIDGGSGSTYAIEMTQKILGTYLPPKTKQLIRELGDNKKEGAKFEGIKTKLRNKGKLPLVIVSPYEHHSNEITWRKQLCDVVEVPLAMDEFMDMVAFEQILKENKGKRPIFGSFSAGSNVTGLKTNVEIVARLCKAYNARCFFDYAGVGPYVPIDLSQKTEDGRVMIDGIFISPHKFLGGPGSCGILIMNRECYDNKLHPTHGGGGTVNAVGLNYEDYVEDVEEREKSGTPGILQIIRAGLAFRLKGLLQDIITKKEGDYNMMFYERMSKIKNLIIFGPKDEHSRVTIIPLNIMMNGPEGMRPLHFSLAIRLFSDIFGIQGRGGCFCAGPYGHHLLKIDEDTSNRFSFFLNHHEEFAGKKDQIINFKPGWVRVNLHYSLQEYELDYLMFAIEYLCEHGHKFLPLYTYDPCKGLWEHLNYKWKAPKLDIGCVLNEKREYVNCEEDRRKTFERQKKEALELLKDLPESKGYDSVPEMGFLSFYYFEKGNLLNRHVVEKKCEVYKEHFLDWVRPDM